MGAIRNSDFLFWTQKLDKSVKFWDQEKKMWINSYSTKVLKVRFSEAGFIFSLSEKSKSFSQILGSNRERDRE